MAVAEVNTLSGYKFDGEEMQKLTGIPDLQRVELDNDDTKMNLYFNPVPNKLFWSTSKIIINFVARWWARLSVIVQRSTSDYFAFRNKTSTYDSTFWSFSLKI